MKVSPAYYTEWLSWAAGKYRQLQGEDRSRYIKEVFELWNDTFVSLSPLVGGLTLGKALKLAVSRWDPLESVRNKMEAMRKSYGL